MDQMQLSACYWWRDGDSGHWILTATGQRRTCVTTATLTYEMEGDRLEVSP